MNTCITLKGIFDARGLSVESGAHLRKDKPEKIPFILTSGKKEK